MTKYALTIFCFFSQFTNLIFAQHHEFRSGDSIVTSLYNQKAGCTLGRGFGAIGNVKSGAILDKSPGINISKTATSDFEVKFIGFPAEAEAAVQKAIDIWAANLKSPVKINIFANWTVLQNSNTLAFVVPTEVRNFSEAPEQNVWYPITLAEKLQSADLNSVDEADIVATFNAGRNDWYFGTDGNCPLDKFDLVTIALHELGHGLGFSGTFFVNNGAGSFGANGTSSPKIYDTRIRNASGNFLVDTFASGSFELGNQLTSNSLVFDSPLAMTLSNTGADPRIYAPNPYNPGSSISHLDETTYANTNNKLMTPFAGRGEVQHSPGPIVKGIFYEMGWINTYLSHEEIGDVEVLNGNDASLTVIADTTLLSNSVKLFFNVNSGALQEQPLLAQGDLWTGSFNSPSFNSTITYFFKANDIFGRQYRLPRDPNQSFSFFYGTDLIKPVIEHTPISELVSLQKLISIQASVTDNLGLQEVLVEYSVNNNVTKTAVLNLSNNSTFVGTIDLSVENLKGGDVLNYRIKAVDASSQLNTTFFPSTGNLSVNVRLFENRNTYTTDFNVANSDFFGDFFTNTQTGFVNGAIHTPHPYPNSIGASPEDLTHILLYPIIIKNESSFMDFNEVVLVNPSDGDFVVVEASTDNGNNWIPVTSQYSSAQNSDWLTRFNSNIQLGDSKALGALSLFKNKRIDLLDFLNPGDRTFFRFRLHSNQTGNGWGWVIDNLRVQDVVLSANNSLEEQLIYPNPVHQHYLFLSNVEDSEASLDFFDSAGRLVKQMDKQNVSLGIDVSDLKNGIYFVRIQQVASIYVSKFIIAR